MESDALFAYASAVPGLGWTASVIRYPNCERAQTDHQMNTGSRSILLLVTWWLPAGVAWARLKYSGKPWSCAHPAMV